jgi:hypothetical protein
MWLSLALLDKLTDCADYGALTVDRAGVEASAMTPEPELNIRLLHHGRLVGRLGDEQLANALVALLDAIPTSLHGFAETYVDLLRQHAADPATGLCGECGQPAPCGTRSLLQEKVGMPTLLSSAPPQRP